MVSSLPIIRYVLVREQITIIHGHSAFSTLAHETMMIGRLLGIQVKFIQLLYIIIYMYIINKNI